MLKDKIIEAKEIVGIKAMNKIKDDLDIQMWDDKAHKGLCPFHKEKTPSFTWNEKDNHFKCFGCGKVYGILDHFQEHYKYSTSESLSRLFKAAQIDYNHNYSKPKKYKFPHEELPLTSESVVEYLKIRNISKSTLDYAQVKQDANGNIAFEYHDEGNTLMLVKYRPARKINKGESKTWCQKDADTAPVLWGMNKINPEKPLIITEGEIDRLTLIEAGYLNVVSIPLGAGNTHWIEYNYDWLEQFGEIIICADNDDAGQKMLDEAIPRLGDWRCKTINYFPVSHDGKEIVPNDLNELLYFGGIESIITIISEATEVPIKNIKDLYDVDDIDLSKLQGFNCGIDGLSEMIDKFFMGTLTVVTGQRGAGKSSLIGQMCVCEPLNQGFKSFVYSGELTDYQLKKWIEYPMAGRRHIIKCNTNENQPPMFEIDNDAKKAMSEWYKNKVFVYDNMLDVSAITLLETMQNMARKFGVKVFTIDNLMTVDIDGYKRGDSNANEKAFVLDLVKFALQFNVCVFLIAHPRKLHEGSTRLTNDDVAGSGNITNLAHYTLALHRVTEEEQTRENNPINADATMRLLKNRFLGIINREVPLFYDSHFGSRRYYENEKKLDKQYGWEKQQ